MLPGFGPTPKPLRRVVPGPHLLLIEPFLGSSPPFFDTMKRVWVKRIYPERDPTSLERTEDPLTGALLDLGRFGFSLSPTPQTRAPKYQAILPADPGPSRIAPNCQGSFFLGRGWPQSSRFVDVSAPLCTCLLRDDGDDYDYYCYCHYYD